MCPQSIIWVWNINGTDLFLQRTVEDEDEHALEGIKGGEKIRHDDGVLIDEEEAEGPGQTQEEEQCDSPQSPGPEGEHAYIHNTYTYNKNIIDNVTIMCIFAVEVSHLMLSRRLESGLRADELRTILWSVIMRNTRFN